jgi:hypothetical protein
MSNPKLVRELLSKKAIYASEAGYWKARGFEDFPGWSKLPFADFFEDLSQTTGEGHKKMWLNPDGTFKAGRLSYSCDTLMSLYNGIQLTQQRIVSAGFFIYSALIVNLHIRMANYSRKYGCEANVPAILEVANAADKKDLENRALALRISAYLIYEGDGLGGYSDPVWKLWGRIFGIACPDNPSVLSAQEAQEGNEEWKEADDEERKQLFYEWWCDINETHAKVPQAIVNHIYVGFKLVNRYQRMESPSCPEEFLFDPKSTFDCQAAICGFFRRSAGGYSESKGHDSNDLTNVPNYLAESLADAEGKVRKLLTGHNGLTPFGTYIINLMELTLRRIDIVSKVVERQNSDHQAIEGMVKKGFAVRLNKRGRVRKSFN